MFSSRVTCEQALIISALVRVFLHPPESIRRQEVSKGSSTLKISPNPSQLVSNLAAGEKTRRLASLQACSLALGYILIEKELKTRRRSISSMFTILGERLSQKKHLPPLNNKRLSVKDSKKPITSTPGTRYNFSYFKTTTFKLNVIL